MTDHIETATDADGEAILFRRHDNHIQFCWRKKLDGTEVWDDVEGITVENFTASELRAMANLLEVE